MLFIVFFFFFFGPSQRRSALPTEPPPGIARIAESHAAMGRLPPPQLPESSENAKRRKRSENEAKTQSGRFKGLSAKHFFGCFMSLNVVLMWFLVSWSVLFHTFGQLLSMIGLF